MARGRQALPKANNLPPRPSPPPPKKKKGWAWVFVRSLPVQIPVLLSPITSAGNGGEEQLCVSCETPPPPPPCPRCALVAAIIPQASPYARVDDPLPTPLTADAPGTYPGLALSSCRHPIPPSPVPALHRVFLPRPIPRPRDGAVPVAGCAMRERSVAGLAHVPVKQPGRFFGGQVIFFFLFFPFLRTLVAPPPWVTSNRRWRPSDRRRTAVGYPPPSTPSNRHRLPCNRRQLPSHRRQLPPTAIGYPPTAVSCRWFPFKCRPLVPKH